MGYISGGLNSKSLTYVDNLVFFFLIYPNKRPLLIHLILQVYYEIIFEDDLS